MKLIAPSMDINVKLTVITEIIDIINLKPTKPNMPNKSFTIACRRCQREFVITINTDDLQKYLEGELLQNAFPYLKAEERELLKTHLCNECWDIITRPKDDKVSYN